MELVVLVVEMTVVVVEVVAIVVVVIVVGVLVVVVPFLTSLVYIGSTSCQSTVNCRCLTPRASNPKPPKSGLGLAIFGRNPCDDGRPGPVNCAATAYFGPLPAWGCCQVWGGSDWTRQCGSLHPWAF